MIQFKFPYINVLNYEFESKQVKLLPKKVADKFSAIVLDEHGKTLTVALPNPEENLEDLPYSLKIRETIKNLESLINRNILVCISAKCDLDVCINREYRRR